MTEDGTRRTDVTPIAEAVQAFYERHPYPPPVDDLDRYRQRWDDRRRRVESHFFWPDEPYRDDRSVLVAGCGTSQAAKYALRWPRAQVTGIDVSATSIERTEELRRKYRLDNLTLRQLPVDAPALTAGVQGFRRCARSLADRPRARQAAWRRPRVPT